MQMKTVAVLAMLASASAWSSAAQEAPNEAKPRPVRLIEVAHAPDVVSRQFFGRVVARQSVDLAFQVGGPLAQFPVTEGQIVPKGGLIAQLDTKDFTLALDKAVVQKTQADRTVERLTRLKGSTVSQVALDDATTQADLAAIAERNARNALDNATLSAPFDALVAARNVANYTLISAGKPVVRLHDMSEIRIEIDVPEVLFQKANGDAGVTMVAKFPASDKTYPLEVREFNAETGRIGQTFRLTFGMAPQKDLLVLPGSSATVLVSMPSESRAMIVPPTAIGSDAEGKPVVFVYKGENDQGTLIRTPVTFEVTQNGALSITSGLQDGAEIVSAGVGTLRDGQTVRRFTGFAN